MNNYYLNRINSKEELYDLINQNVVDTYYYDYLMDLINLKYSVLKNNIFFDDDLFVRIARYNIYKRALQIFSRTKSNLIFDSNSNGLSGLSVKTDKDKKIYKYEFYQENSFKIGDIDLYQNHDHKLLNDLYKEFLDEYGICDKDFIINNDNIYTLKKGNVGIFKHV